MSLPTDKEIDDGIRRIAYTVDGQLLYRRLQMILMSIPASTHIGALRENAGRRMLARELKLLMDEELAKVASERVRSTGSHDPDAPAVTRRAEPVAVARPGTGRRVEPYAESGDKT